jgi:predicted alpha/beta-hydrolase family hydrolase
VSQDSRRFDGPAAAAVTLILAHGAGAGMDHPFLARVARGLAAAGLRVVRFEFPYMAKRRGAGGGRGGRPDPPAVLEASWRRVIEEVTPGARRLAIGGKSMGGRIASMVADAADVDALICLGYPFHPPGRPERLRTAHLAGLTTPALIVQGTRDPFGTREEVEGYTLSPSIRVHWIEDGDHSLAPRKSSGRTASEAIEEAIGTIVGFLGTGGHPEDRPPAVGSRPAPRGGR